MYKSIRGLDICSTCGYGSPSVAQRAAEKQKKIEEDNRQREEDAKPRSDVIGTWRLDIYFRLKGSKSEGQHGILFHNGEIVEPKQVGEAIHTDLGLLKYYCRLEDIEYPFELTGWNYADRKKIRPSYYEE